MKWSAIVLGIGIVASPAIAAETLGLRFVVDEHLVQSDSQRQLTQTRLANHVAELNGYFANSLVNLRAEIEQITFSAIEENDAVAVLDDMAAERNGFAGLFAKADEYGADYTFAVVDDLMLHGKRGCGRGYAVNKTVAEIASIRHALAVVDIACGAHTLAHELGHLLGLNHGNLIDSCLPGKGHKTALTPYAQGYAAGNCDQKPQADEFGTIMVGGFMREVTGDSHGSLPLFSNPRLRDKRCGARGICGDAETADAARVLNEHAHYYAAHAEPDVHVLSYRSPALAQCMVEHYRYTEIDELEELICPNAGIDSIAGVERLTHLKRIDLSANPLADASPLLALVADQIEWIKLSSPLLNPLSLRQLTDRFGAKIIASEAMP